MLPISHISNPLVTPEQLLSSASQLGGIPRDLEESIRYVGARLTQAAGQLLRLPQDVIAQAIVIYTRFWIGTEGGSLKEFGASDVSAAAIYLIAKLSAYPKSPRSVINVYAYLDSFPSSFPDAQMVAEINDANRYHVTEGTYAAQRALLMRTEALILRVLSFQTHVALPHALCITYLQTLDAFYDPKASVVGKRAFAHLNAVLLSPQLVYLTHQPNALASAAIYLAAREVGLKLPGEEWWEVFDTDREELGFLVVAMLSTPGFAAQEKEVWGKRKVPMIVEEVEAEVERRKLLENGE